MNCTHVISAGFIEMISRFQWNRNRSVLSRPRSGLSELRRTDASCSADPLNLSTVSCKPPCPFTPSLILDGCIRRTDCLTIAERKRAQCLQPDHEHRQSCL